MERLRQLVSEMLIYCFVLVLLTGGFLTFHYTPSGELIPYTGAYEPLRGVMMTTAYDSLLTLSFDAPHGLLMRQGTGHDPAVLLVLPDPLEHLRRYGAHLFERDETLAPDLLGAAGPPVPDGQRGALLERVRAWFEQEAAAAEEQHHRQERHA